MKKACLLATIVAAHVVLATLPLRPIESISLLKNGNFEEQNRDGTPARWAPAGKAPEGVILSHEEYDGRENSRCISVTSTYELDRPWFWWEQNCRLDQAQSCKMSFWFKSIGIARGAVAVLSSVSADGKQLKRQHLPLPIGREGWVQVSETLSLPDGAARGKLQFSMHGTGRFWVDDVELSIPTAVKHEPLGLGSVYPVMPAPRPVQIDGQSEEWNGISRGRVLHAYQVSNAQAIVMDQETSRGSDDLSFSFALSHDAEALNILVEVNDDHFYPAKQYWRGDSIQCAIDPEYDRTPDGFSPRDIAFGISFPGGKTTPVLDFPNGPNSPDVTQIQACTTHTAKGYTTEIRVPWKMLLEKQSPLPDKIGFCLVVNDNDGSGRKWAEWTPGITIGKHPSLFGTLLLQDQQSPFGMVLEPPVSDAKDTSPLQLTARLLNASETDRNVDLELELTAGNTVCVDHRQLVIPPGTTVLPLVYAPENLPAGRAVAHLRADTATADAQFTILPLRRIVNETKARVAKIQTEMAKLGKMIRNGNEQQLDTAFPDASLAVAEHFCRWIEADLVRDGDETLAEYESIKLGPIVTSAIEEMQAILASPDTNPQRPAPDALKAWLEKGNWVVDGRPLFLIGLNQYDSQWLCDLPRLGGNTFTAGGGTPAYLMKNDEKIDPEDIRRSVGRNIREARELGISSNLLFGHRMPSWAIEKWPDIDEVEGHFMYYDIDHPEARRMTCEVIEATTKILRDEPGIHACDLWNEASYFRMSARGMANFRAAMQEQYGTIEALNAAWNTSFSTFESVTPVTRDPERAAAYADWVSWNDKRFGGYIREMNAAAKRGNPEVLTTVKFSNEATIVGSYNHAFRQQGTSRHNMGVNRWQMARLLDIQGCDTRPTLLSPDYAFAWRYPGMAYDLQRSMAPEKPIADSEWHGIQTVYYENKDQPPEFLNAALWFSYLHGMDMNITWWWSRQGTEPKTQWFRGSLLTQPQLLDAWARNNILVQRLAPEIIAFQETTPRIRILFSKPSAILDLHYLDTERNLYEALHWFGMPVGFVTEEMLLSGSVDCDVLFLPSCRHCNVGVRDAVSRLVTSGVPVAAVGDGCLTLAPHGKPYPEDGRTIASVTIPDTTDQPILRDLVASLVSRPDIQCLGPDGKTSYPVEFRTTEHNGQTLAYLIGLGKEPADIRIVRGENPVTCTSLLTGKTFAGKRTVAPYDIDLMIIK